MQIFRQDVMGQLMCTFAATKEFATMYGQALDLQASWDLFHGGDRAWKCTFTEFGAYYLRTNRQSIEGMVSRRAALTNKLRLIEEIIATGNFDEGSAVLLIMSAFRAKVEIMVVNELMPWLESLHLWYNKLEQYMDLPYVRVIPAPQ